MSLDYYLFASYVFLLVCIIVVICKFLFADQKRQQKMLDEKESKLLRTYQTLEDAMDEFYDLVAESKNEINEKYTQLNENLEKAAETASLPQAQTPQITDAQTRPPVKRPPKSRQTKKTEHDPLAFERLFDEITSKPTAALSPTHEQIIEMSKSGKPRAEIAKTLKITQNEVELVIGMNKSSGEAK